MTYLAMEGVEHLQVLALLQGIAHTMVAHCLLMEAQIALD
jgi:hypothetical protein